MFETQHNAWLILPKRTVHLLKVATPASASVIRLAPAGSAPFLLSGSILEKNVG
jgi:hypothetical protein